MKTFLSSQTTIPKNNNSGYGSVGLPIRSWSTIRCKNKNHKTETKQTLSKFTYGYGIIHSVPMELIQLLVKYFHSRALSSYFFSINAFQRTQKPANHISQITSHLYHNYTVRTMLNVNILLLAPLWNTPPSTVVKMRFNWHCQTKSSKRTQKGVKIRKKISKEGNHKVDAEMRSAMWRVKMASGQQLIRALLSVANLGWINMGGVLNFGRYKNKYK